MKTLIILSTLVLCSCANENGDLVIPMPEKNMAAAASASDNKPVNLRPNGTTTSATPPFDSVKRGRVIQPEPQVMPSTSPPVFPSSIPQDMRNSNSVYLSDNFDDALLKTGRPDFIQYQGNRAFVSYKAKDFTMYEGGECKVTFEKRLVQKCEGCNIQRFPCSE